MILVVIHIWEKSDSIKVENNWAVYDAASIKHHWSIFRDDGDDTVFDRSISMVYA